MKDMHPIRITDFIDRGMRSELVIKRVERYDTTLWSGRFTTQSPRGNRCTLTFLSDSLGGLIDEMKAEGIEVE